MTITKEVYYECKNLGAPLRLLRYIAFGDKTTWNLFTSYKSWWLWFTVNNLNLDLQYELNTFNLDKLNSKDLTYLIFNYPDLVDQLDLDNLESDDIQYLILYKPLLIRHFDLSRLDTNNIRYLLLQYPDLIQHFDLSILETKDVKGLLKHHPQLATYFYRGVKC